MATDTQIKIRTAQELDRLTKTANRLAKRLPDIEAPEIPTRHKYPEMLALAQVAALADFLDAIDAAIKDEGYAATPKPQGGEGGSALPDMKTMTRGALNSYADEYRIADPESYPNKAALIAAITERQQTTMNDDPRKPVPEPEPEPEPEPMPEPPSEPTDEDEGA